MRIILQIVTQGNDRFAHAVMDNEQNQPEIAIRKFDLAVAEPDYDRLLEEIFKADAIHVW